VSTSATGMGSYLSKDESVFSYVFVNLDSDYKLNKTIRRNLMFVQPVQMVLANPPDKKAAVFSYIPITLVLKLVLSNNEIRDHILSRQNLLSSGDAMTSFVDGNIFKQHLSFFQSSKCH